MVSMAPSNAAPLADPVENSCSEPAASNHLVSASMMYEALQRVLVLRQPETNRLMMKSGIAMAAGTLLSVGVVMASSGG